MKGLGAAIVRRTRGLGAWIATGASTCALASAAAEIRFVDATDRLPPKEAVGCNSMDVESADLDGDGDLDLVVAQEFLPNKILRNEGGGRFADASDLLPPLSLAGGPAGHDTEDVSVADLDGDGRLDLVFVSEDDVKMGRSEVHEYYRGTAEGKLERVRGVLPDTEANAVAHADLNGDGRPELLIVGAAQDRLLVNDGKGGFRDETAERLPREAAVGQDGEFADVDRDGDLDIVLALEGGHALWINDGRGRFDDVTRERLPSFGRFEARKVAPVDLDRDGDLDLCFSHVGWMALDPRDRFLANDGKGGFADTGSAWLPEERDGTLDSRFADLDGDGDLDLVRVNMGPLRVLENDGKGALLDVSATALPAEIAGPGVAVEIADLDGDGALDLYVGMLAGPKKDPAGFDRLLLGVRTKR
jgi:hypothetical protein